MIHRYSPYRYVDLDSTYWDQRSAENKRREDLAEIVSASEETWYEIVTELFKYPRTVGDRVEKKEQQKNVCVIGGGIAGLTAAYELVKLNHHVTLLEASDRFGGRIWTHQFGKDSDGNPLYGELGAMRIPYSHGCVRHYVDLFKLKQRPFVSVNDAALILLRGKNITQRDGREKDGWNKLRAHYGLSSSKRPNPFDHIDKLINDWVFAKILVSDLASIFTHFEVPAHLQDLEQMSLWQFLRKDVKMSDSEWEYIGRATGSLWLERASALQFALNELPLKAPNKFEICGGMEVLVDAFVAELKEEAATGAVVLHKNAPVTSVKLRGQKVEVTSLSGVPEMFDYVICAVPGPATARIAFDDPLPHATYEALTNLSYMSAAKTIIHCTERFWESKYGIFGGGSYTDLPNQQCWYPSDNSAEENNGNVNFGSMSNKPQGKNWKAHNRQRSSAAGVFTAAYMWETNARRFAALDTAQRTELVLSSIDKIHTQQSIRNYIKDIKQDVVHCAWDTEVNPGGGAFAFFAPGEQSRYQAALCAPHLVDTQGQARVFFAGEHVAIVHAWIQSAIQSALTAVMDVHAAPAIMDVREAP